MIKNIYIFEEKKYDYRKLSPNQSLSFLSIPHLSSLRTHEVSLYMGRNEHLWLTSSRFFLTNKHSDVVSAIHWHFLLRRSQVLPASSDVLLPDATLVFVLDIVPALIINCSNYFGPYPPFWKQCVEQEKPHRTQAQTQSPPPHMSNHQQDDKLSL